MYVFAISLAVVTLFSIINAAPTHLTKRGSGKAGISWPVQELSATPVEAFFGSGSSLTWWFDWNKNYIPAIFTDDSTQAVIWKEFVPMEYDASFLNNGQNYSFGWTEVMGYNEPDLQSSTGVSTFVDPGTAANNWKQLVRSVRGQKSWAKLHSPAVASDITWLQSFANAICPGYPGSWSTCEYAWDYTSVHLYTTDAGYFSSQVSDYHNMFGLPVVVSEFACYDFESGPQVSQQDAANFMGQTTQWLDEQDWVIRYAWFGAVRNAAWLYGVADANRLMHQNGQLTVLGQQYVGGGHD